MAKFNDLTGRRFGKLTVIKRVKDYISKNGKKRTQWLCQCDCGNKVKVLSQSLTSESTLSCGCLAKENCRKLGKSKKKYNKYDLSGEYGIGYTFKGEEFLFDLEDYDKIKDYCWHNNGAGYIEGRDTNTGLSVFMHRLIMNPDKSEVVDHINHNPLDNRKNNLRICTQHQNTMNCKIPSNNSSGIKGVTYDNYYKKWVAFIGINHKKKTLGYFTNIDDAIETRLKAEKEYYGDFAYNEIEE